MNDSGFWTIGRMTGISEKETLPSFSMTMAVMSLNGLVIVLVLAWLFPLV